jgi:PAS domain S-box-containing protein
MVYRCLDDEPWSFEFVSDGVFELTGYQPSDFIPKGKVSYAQLIHSEDRERVRRKVREAVQNNKAFQIDYRITSASAEQKWVWERGTGVFSPEGELQAIEGFITDISEYRMTEEKVNRLILVLSTIRNVNQLLVKENERGRLLKGICDILVENRGYFNAWIALVDDSGRLAATTESGLGKKFLPMLELLESGERPECIRKALIRSEIVLTKDPVSDCIGCPLAKMYSGRTAMTVCLEHQGKLYGTLAVSIPADIEVGEEERSLFQEIASDIAFGMHRMELEEEHEKTDEALKQLASIVEYSDDAIIRMTLDGTIVNWNNGAEKIYGYGEADAVGQHISMLVPPGRPDEVPGILEKIKRGELVDHFETIRQRKDGSLFEVSLTVSPVRDTQGRIVGASSIARDITEQKEAERVVRDSEKLALVGKLAASTAHSIRNPLTSVKMRLFSLGRRLNLSESESEDFDVISEEIRNVDNILRSFLEFSRPPQIEKKMLSPSQVVDAALRLLHHRLESYNAEIELERQQRLAPVMIDPNQLEEVLVNLLVNACEAMGIGGKIVISEKQSTLHSLGQVVIITVSDDGPGIPQAIQESVFEPFFSTKEEGTGLGLSIASRITEDHGGKLTVDSQVGKGTSFRIILPCEEA